jgi:hypothetical protein
MVMFWFWLFVAAALIIVGLFIFTQGGQSLGPAIVTVGVVIVLILIVSPARAADLGGHTHHGAAGRFYQTWMRPDNRAISCCHDKDCAPAQSKLVGGRWQARNSDGEPWIEVPDSRVERDRDSPDGRSHLCKAGTIGSVLVYCFLPANGS